MNSKHVGPAALVATLIGLVGGGAYAANVAFQPVEKPAPRVELVQPAAETVTPTVEVTVTPSATSTTVAPEPVKSVKVAVPSKPKATTTSAAPQTVQRQAIVSETPADPTPSEAPYTPPAGSAADSMQRKLQSPPPPPPAPAK